MTTRIMAALLSAGAVLACGTPEVRDEGPGPAPAAGAAMPGAPAATRLEAFVEAPAAGAQLLFVGQEPMPQTAEWPGAVFVPLTTFSVERDGIPNEFPPAEVIAASLESAGVRGGRVIIVGAPIPAGRAFAAFDYLGIAHRAALLDGGPAAVGEPPAAAPATPRPSARETRPAGLDVRVRGDMIVDADWVHARLNDPDVVLIDARPPAEFNGETPGDGIERPGHIPGAHNLFWQQLLRSAEDPRLRDEAELRRMFEQAGVTPAATIVAYCRTGGQSSFLYAVARHLGYDVRLYDGSFVDWSRTDYPVAR
jgi:thiosulfate/3-mercaptopyruvate sulfurtransferase